MKITSSRKVTAAEMQAIDRRAIEEYGIPRLVLMENAGRSVAEVVEEIARTLTLPLQDEGGGKGRGRVLVFCGKGNNGGDGLAAARHLHNRGYQVQIFLFADPEKLKEDPAVNFRIVAKMGIPVEVVNPEKGDRSKDLSPFSLLIDALFGVGLSKNIEEPFTSVIDTINQSGKRVIAVDIPSGLNSDTGTVMGSAVKADITATLALPKKGLYEGEGPRYSGQIRVVDIGIPKELLK